MVNDAAALNIDKMIVGTHLPETVGATSEASLGRVVLGVNFDQPPQVVGLSNGCMCCGHGHGGNKNDFSEAVAKLLEADAASPASWVDYLVVETSGVMDPTPLIATLDQRWGVMHKVRPLAV